MGNEKKGKIYKFYQTEQEEYFNGELKRVLKQIDLMFSTFVRENIVVKSIDKYTQFFRKFTVPDEDCLDIWQIWEHPLLIINLTVKEVERDKKKKKTETDIIIYDPTFE